MVLQYRKSVQNLLFIQNETLQNLKHGRVTSNLRVDSVDLKVVVTVTRNLHGVATGWGEVVYQNKTGEQYG